MKSDKLPDVQWGLEFQPEWNSFMRHQYCARWGAGTMPTFNHRRWMIEQLWKPVDYEMHYWSNLRLKSVCENTFVTWMGPASSSKTTDAAAFAVEYWLENPGDTAVIVASTTKDMLRKRIWGEICRLWHRVPGEMYGTGGYKGDLLDTACIIRWAPNDMKNGIFGVAVSDGPVEEAINNLIGVHTSRVWLILDEMQGVREAIMGALPNMVKNPESRFLGMGNPTSIMSMLCKYSEPINGWNSVVRGETPDWEIDPGPYLGKGRAFFFDGRKSPAVLDPEWGKTHPWMISKEQVEHHIAKKGMNSPEVWTMTIGWPPPLGTDNTVLDIAIIEKFRCRETAIWTNGFTAGAALDPAFVDGGDRKVLQFFKQGQVADENGSLRWVIEFGEWLDVPIDSGSTEPVEYQLVRYVRERCESKGIRADRVATDSTGIGRGLLSVFHKEWGPVVGIEFGGKPSELTVDEQGKKGTEVYDRRSSELNISVRAFANANGIRGLSKEAADEFTSRLTTYDGKYKVESKKDYKKRNGKSPDIADSCCIAVALARMTGAVPSDKVIMNTHVTEDHRKKLIEIDRRFDEQNYAKAEDWSAWPTAL